MLDIALSAIRVMDTARIIESSVLDDVTDDVASFVRKVVNDHTKKYFIAEVKALDGVYILGILGLENISGKNRSGEASMYFSKTLPFLGDSDYTEETGMEYYVASMDLLLKYAFFTMNLHRISTMVAVTDSFTDQIVQACQMRQEALLSEAVCIDDTYQDAGLFSMLDSEYPNYSVGFVPFPRGVIAVRGDNTTIESTHFYAYEKYIEETLDRNVAIHMGIADEKGVLKPHDASDFENIWNMKFPDEVTKCMKELAEYFGKRRTTFTVHAFSPYGSAFQKKVWEKILEIPYGVTRSYEEIALALTGNDKIAARNMTRAVGSACRDNPLPILVPCHRVVGKDGKLVGFHGGLEYKSYLLDHELFGIHLC